MPIVNGKSTNPASLQEGAKGHGPITLSQNEIYEFLSNMLISTQVFTDNIKDNAAMSLVDMSRVDGGLYGDTKRWISTDVLKTYPWGGDAEAENLLKTHRAPDPKEQIVTIDNFRMIPLTVDQYLTKRAFSDEGTFSQFNSALTGWMRKTKKVYDATMFNTFIGTTTAETDAQNVEITLPAEPTGDEVTEEAFNRLQAQAIGYQFANLLVNLEDVSRDFTDFQNLRSFDADDFVYVWNSDWVNKITKLDLPTVFHKENMIDKFAQHTLHPRFFGDVKTESGNGDGTIRSLVERDYNTVENMSDAAYDPMKHIFPGDLIPEGSPYNAYEAYTPNDKIMCKIYHKDSIPFMSAFETGTEFNNPRALLRTKYLIWGYSTLEYLKDLPFITVTAKLAE